MKHVHRVLQLRPHKHTAKLLPHKHTSYGALFALMLLPIAAMVLVGHFVSASSYDVTAKVPAQLPNAAPVITSPSSGTVYDESIVVRGTCPVVQPAVIIVIYNGTNPVGSTQCSSNGTFSVAITVPYGSNSLKATIVTVTGDVGQSSSIVVITRLAPSSAGSTGYSGLVAPLYIIPTDLFMIIDSDGQVTWHGKVIAGQAPYKMVINWGDGLTSRYDVASSEEQAFVHNYDAVKAYEIVITVTDASGSEVMYRTMAITLIPQKYSLLYLSHDQVHPIISFIQANVLQIYIFTLSALVFLWFLEHGRHATKEVIRHSIQGNNKRHRRRKV